VSRTGFSRIRNLPQAVLGLALGVFALWAVGFGEQVLQPHAEHMRARAALRQINQTLRLSLDRRDDLRGDLQLTFRVEANPQSKVPTATPAGQNDASFPYKLTTDEVDRYRRAAVAELYEIHLRIASLIRRGNELIETLDRAPGLTTKAFRALCLETKLVAAREVQCSALQRIGSGTLSQLRETADTVFDAAVMSGTYSQTVYHVGSLGLILVGYLAIGSVLVSGLGAVFGASMATLRELLVKWIPSGGASVGALVAGVVGAGAVAASVGAATVAGFDGSFFGANSASTRGVPAAINTPAPDSATKPNSNNSAGETNNYNAGDTFTTRYFNAGQDAGWTADPAVAKIAVALQALSAKEPVVVRVPSTADPALLNVISGAGKAVGDSILASDRDNDRRMSALSQGVIDVTESLKRILREQQMMREVVQAGTADAKTAVDAVATATIKVNDTATKLLPIARDTSCQVEWQRSLNARNGLQRVWHAVGGYRANPCGRQQLSDASRPSGEQTSGSPAHEQGSPSSSRQ
jgi:hypothetical protein